MRLQFTAHTSCEELLRVRWGELEHLAVGSSRAASSVARRWRQGRGRQQACPISAFAPVRDICYIRIAAAGSSPATEGEMRAAGKLGSGDNGTNGTAGQPMALGEG